MRFLKPALRVLSSLYSPVGGIVATERIDLEGSIQLVHDVSREAELASGVGLNTARGWWIMSQTLNVAGAGVNYATSLNPTAVLAAASIVGPVPPREEVDIWLMDLWVSSLITPNVITSVTVGIFHGNLPGVSGGSPPELIFTSSLAVPMNNSGADMYGMYSPLKPALPKFIEPGAIFVARTDATGAAGTALAQYSMYIGPKGTLPPGVS